MNVPRLSDVIESAELIFDRDVLEDAIEDMADAIRELASQYAVPPIVVLRGDADESGTTVERFLPA